nr:putative ribonuclease H-like domain-containing protein [Tanacetum cinerariifolium]
LEDIIYSDDEDVVGAQADFKSLKSSIPVSPIPTTRIYKDHPVSQIIGDLSSTTQTKSMTRAVKDQAYASFMGFMVYQMDVKSAFTYDTIEEEVYVCQPPGFKDLDHPDKVKEKKDGIFTSQDKYVAEILRKFGLTKGKSASTPIVQRSLC